MNEQQLKNQPRKPVQATSSLRLKIRARRAESVPSHDDKLTAIWAPTVLTRLPEILPESQSKTSSSAAARIDQGHPTLAKPPNLGQGRNDATQAIPPTVATAPEAPQRNAADAPVMEIAVAVAPPQPTELHQAPPKPETAPDEIGRSPEPPTAHPAPPPPHIDLGRVTASTASSRSPTVAPKQSPQRAPRQLKLEEATQDADWVDWAVKVAAAIIAIILLALAWRNMQRQPPPALAHPAPNLSAWPAEEPPRIALRDHGLTTRSRSSTDEGRGVADTTLPDGIRPQFVDISPKKASNRGEPTHLELEEADYPTTGSDDSLLELAERDPRDTSMPMLDESEPQYPETGYAELPRIADSPVIDRPKAQGGSGRPLAKDESPAHRSPAVQTDRNSTRPGGAGIELAAPVSEQGPGDLLDFDPYVLDDGPLLDGAEPDAKQPSTATPAQPVRLNGNIQKFSR